MQLCVSAGIGIQIDATIHGVAAHLTDIQDWIHRYAYLAIAEIIIADACGIGQGIGHEAGAVFVDQEGLERDGIAVRLHGSVHRGQIVAHQPLHGLGIHSYPLHAGQVQHLAAVVPYNGRIAADTVGAEGVQVGGCNAVCRCHIGLDKICDTGRSRHGDAHGQRSGHQHTLGKRMTMFLFFVYHFVYLRKRVRGGMQCGKGLLEQFTVNHIAEPPSG